MAIYDNPSGPGGFGLGGSGDDPNQNRKTQPGAVPPDPDGLESTGAAKTKARRRNRNALIGGQAGQVMQVGDMQELAQLLQGFDRLRQDFARLQQDLVRERQAREQLEGRVNDIQQQLQQGVPQDGQGSIRASSISDDSEVELLRELDRSVKELFGMDDWMGGCCSHGAHRDW